MTSDLRKIFFAFGVFSILFAGYFLWRDGVDEAPMGLFGIGALFIWGAFSKAD